MGTYFRTKPPKKQITFRIYIKGRLPSGQVCLFRGAIDNKSQKGREKYIGRLNFDNEVAPCIYIIRGPRNESSY